MKEVFAISVSIIAMLVANAARAESLLVTQTGNDIGLSLSSYQYQEPSIMSSKGAKLGLDARTIRVLENGHFLRGDLRYAFGSVDYTGSGTVNGQQDWYIESRGVAGRDWSVGESVLAAYAGLGYRSLPMMRVVRPAQERRAIDARAIISIYLSVSRIATH